MVFGHGFNSRRLHHTGANIAMLEVVSLERLTLTSLTLESAPSSKPPHVEALEY